MTPEKLLALVQQAHAAQNRIRKDTQPFRARIWTKGVEHHEATLRALTLDAVILAMHGDTRILEALAQDGK